MLATFFLARANIVPYLLRTVKGTSNRPLGMNPWNIIHSTGPIYSGVCVQMPHLDKMGTGTHNAATRELGEGIRLL